jgi:hypothetical protein
MRFSFMTSTIEAISITNNPDRRYKLHAPVMNEFPPLVEELERILNFDDPA